MRGLTVVAVVLVGLLSVAVSLGGVLSYGQDQYRTVVTARGETVQMQDAGVYRFSVRSLVVAGIPWDVVRLVFITPLLLVSLVLHVRRSLRGSMLLLGGLGSLTYQGLLWTFDWAYNSLFLVYVGLFSLSLWTAVIVTVQTDRRAIAEAVTGRFPARTAATFSFLLGGMLLLKCLGEIAPTIGTTAMPAGGHGQYTMVDQALDIGLLVPFCAAVATLLLQRRALGYLLSASALVLFLAIGLSVVAGEVALGLSHQRMNVGGIAAFTVFLIAGLLLLIRVLAEVRPSPVAPADPVERT